MSILHMNQFGDIVESDGQGGIKQAALVADDNVQKLSIQEGDSVLKDRMALDAVQKAQRAANFQKFKQTLALNRAKAAHAKIQDDKIYLIKKKMMYLQNLKDSLKVGQALLQNGGYNEKMSGVSGFGLTADGNMPTESTSYFDYKPIVDVGNTANRFDQDSTQDLENYPPSTAPTAEQAVNQEYAVDQALKATQAQLDAEMQTAQAIKDTGMPTAQSTANADAIRNVVKVGAGFFALKLLLKALS